MAEKIIAVVSKNPQVTTQEISDILEISLRSVERGIAALKTSGKLRRVGGRKAGYWQLTKG